MDNNRVYKDSKLIKLPYGAWIGDKKILLYDFEKNEEKVAFDFSLSVGDEFTTMNGMEWEVTAKKDTVLSKADGEKVLLTVRSKRDGRVDRWLEDNGSVYNHFLLMDLDDVEFSRTLWVITATADVRKYLEMYDSFYDLPIFIENFNEDPYYGQDSGWLRNPSDRALRKVFDCSFKLGDLSFGLMRRVYFGRYVDVFYRIGDDIYLVDTSVVEELEVFGDKDDYTNTVTLTGLPEPTSGSYTIHYDGYSVSTGVEKIQNDKAGTGNVYDLQGRRVNEKTGRGLYIEGGKKVMR